MAATTTPRQPNPSQSNTMHKREGTRDRTLSPPTTTPRRPSSPSPASTRSGMHSSTPRVQAERVWRTRRGGRENDK